MLSGRDAIPTYVRKEDIRSVTPFHISLQTSCAVGTRCIIGIVQGDSVTNTDVLESTDAILEGLDPNRAAVALDREMDRLGLDI